MRPPCPPFTPCWCETRPNHPRCQDVPALSIESVGLSLTIIILVVWYLRKKKVFTNMIVKH